MPPKSRKPGLPYDTIAPAERREVVERVLNKYPVTSVEDLVYHMALFENLLVSADMMRGDLRALGAFKVRNWHGDKRRKDFGKLIYKTYERDAVNNPDNPDRAQITEFDVEQDVLSPSQEYRGRKGAVKLW